MEQAIDVIFGLAGGLALFLFGMNSMSDALQKTAGEKMKQILGYLTKNPLIGALAGALVTAVLQSSSATTVMVIGFVSAGLMTLPQAVSVIFGANIGTTMTAQLLAFKLSDYIYPIIFIGFIANFVFKNEKIRNIGMVIFSFGLLFEGIEIMGSVMKPLAASPVFTRLMAQVSDIPVLGVVLGAVMTLVVQSSSATIAVLQNFASQAGPDGVTSVIGLAGAIPILLGDNIGTTITALLASIGQSKNAKRTALAHSIFNISGSIVFLFIIPVFTKFVQFISPKGNELDIISRQIANAHTSFNIVCAIIWLPLVPLMVKMVTFIIRGKDGQEESNAMGKPHFLDENVISQPSAALCLVSEEMSRSVTDTDDLINYAKEALVGKAPDEAIANFDRAYENARGIQKNVEKYITQMLSSGNLTNAQSEQTTGMLFVNNNLLRISDRCNEITDVTKRLRKEGLSLSNEAAGELEVCFQISFRMFNDAVEAVRTGNKAKLSDVLKGKDYMRKAQKQFNKAHIARVKEQVCKASMTADYASILYGLDRIVDNCVAIAEEAAD